MTTELEKKFVLPLLKIKGKVIKVPIIQGGMGVGISLHPLASAVAREGGVGIVSSAALDRLVSRRNGKKLTVYEATYEEIFLAKANGGFAGINIMVALVNDYDDSVRGAIDAKADLIISGGGLPMNLPSIHTPGDTALVPIVSSPRALELIIRKWERWKYRPDAVVLEGPLAGGHLGFKLEDLDLESNRLENLLPPVKDLAIAHGNFPVIVAGGIFTRDDIIRFLALGADGVQMGTRFLATEECSATPEYKRAYIECEHDDILVVGQPGSPCDLPFRVIKHSPMFIDAVKGARVPKCDKGYLIRNGKCNAQTNNTDYFCICNGLLSSCGYNPEEEKPLYTCGTRAGEINKIVPVKELMDELTKGV